MEPYPGVRCTVGVLAMTNFGTRERLAVDGVPVGRQIADLMPLEHREGSCIVVLATDAPLTARQCERLAKRCSLGLAVTGSYAADSSGEFMLAFTTAHRVPRVTTAPLAVTSIGNDAMYRLFEAAVDATAESVYNSLCAATDTEGRDGNRAYALPFDRLVETMGRFGRPGARCLTRVDARLPRVFAGWYTKRRPVTVGSTRDGPEAGMPKLEGASWSADAGRRPRAHWNEGSSAERDHVVATAPMSHFLPVASPGELPVAASSALTP